MPIKRRP